MKKQRRNGWMVVILLGTGLLPLSACQRKSNTPSKIEPAKVERVDDQFSRVVLTPRAAERLGIETVVTSETSIPQRNVILLPLAAVPEPGTQPNNTVLTAAKQESAAMRKVVPYAAVLYDVQGRTWVYTSPEHLVFVRCPVTIDYIDGAQAVLSDGPPSGTKVVTVGVSELYGTEFKVGH